MQALQVTVLLRTLWVVTSSIKTETSWNRPTFSQEHMQAQMATMPRHTWCLKPQPNPALAKGFAWPGTRATCRTPHLHHSFRGTCRRCPRWRPHQSPLLHRQPCLPRPSHGVPAASPRKRLPPCSMGATGSGVQDPFTTSVPRVSKTPSPLPTDSPPSPLTSVRPDPPSTTRARGRVVPDSSKLPEPDPSLLIT